MNWERPDPAPVNPLGWSVPLLGIAGIRLRVHVVFLAYALIMVLRGAFGPAEAFAVHGAMTVSIAVGALFVLVLVRESVRALVVRAAGGAADDVVLWPLGSLQGIDPAPGWMPALLASTVGTAVSALLLAANGIALGTITGDWWGAALPDPFTAAWLSNPHPRWIEALWMVQWTGIQLSLLTLLPMLPLDGGRAMEALVLRRRGAFDTPRTATTITLVVAAVAGAVAMVRNLETLLAVSIACAGYAAYAAWRLRAGDSVAAAQQPWAPAPPEVEDPAERTARANAERDRAAAAAEERAVDLVLEKIAREGADRLTDAERAILAKATARRRGRPGR